MPRIDAAAPTADGIYATFVVSRADAPLGEFHCRLDYDKVPRTVANFVGLAEGSRAWVDFRGNGLSQKPFYDGITFHRVVPGFVIQGGSPAGDGSDGPGYTFRDEFHPDLRHSMAGILSMANSGLNSNGSQFFVTLAATSHLDDLHNVFGATVSAADLTVVQSVQQGDVIDSVTITRNGAAAQAFDVNAQGLPSVEDADASIVKTETGFELDYTQSDDAEFFVFHTGDFQTWSRLAGTEFYFNPPAQDSRDVSSITTGESKRFMAVTRVQYPDALLTPALSSGKRLQVVNNAAGYAFAFDLETPTTGAYQTTIVAGVYPIHAYSWQREAYRGRVTGTISGLAFNQGTDPITTLNISFVFVTGTTGVARGSLTSVAGQSFPVEGLFTVSDL